MLLIGVVLVVARSPDARRESQAIFQLPFLLPEDRIGFRIYAVVLQRFGPDGQNVECLQIGAIDPQKI